MEQNRLGHISCQLISPIKNRQTLWTRSCNLLLVTYLWNKHVIPFLGYKKQMQMRASEREREREGKRLRSFVVACFGGCCTSSSTSTSIVIIYLCPKRFIFIWPRESLVVVIVAGVVVVAVAKTWKLGYWRLFRATRSCHAISIFVVGDNQCCRIAEEEKLLKNKQTETNQKKKKNNWNRNKPNNWQLGI